MLAIKQMIYLSGVVQDTSSREGLMQHSNAASWQAHSMSSLQCTDLSASITPAVERMLQAGFLHSVSSCVWWSCVPSGMYCAPQHRLL